MDIKKTFGGFITEKRLERSLSLRKFAEMIDLSAPFWTEVEKGRKNPPKLEKLETIATVLGLSEEEKTEMFDLAGKDRDDVAPDLPNYIMGNDYVSAALRTARDLGASEDDWERFVEELKKRKG